MHKPLGVGVVGASVDGGWAMQSHVPAIQHVEGVDLRAVATSRPESAPPTWPRTPPSTWSQ